MGWRARYHRYGKAAGGALQWLEKAEFPEDVPEPKELQELDDAYAAVRPAIPPRQKEAIYALETFHLEFGKTIGKLQAFGPTAELLELRLWRLDELFEKLIPHSLGLPAKLRAQMAVAVGTTVAVYVLFPTSLREAIADLPAGVYLAIVGAILVAFSTAMGAVLVKAMRTGAYVGTTGLFVLLPPLLDAALLFGMAYWIPSGEAGGCLDHAVGKLDALYFSLTAMTTTGFGDLAPATSGCRTIVSMQMVTTFVIVTALLSMYVSRASASPR